MDTLNMLMLTSLLCFSTTVFGVRVKLLTPRQSNVTLDVAVIVVPGAEIPGEAYEPLGHRLQTAFPARLWVALLTDFLLKTPNPLELGRGIEDARRQLKNAGFHNNYIFLAGHSLGGVFVGEYGLSHGSSLSGVMLWASYLTRTHKLRDYPVPVLTVAGDVDGLTRVTRLVDTFEELENETIHNPRPVSLIYSTPVIVMRGINHGHFASGTMPPNVAKHDLPVDDDVTFDSAHEMIASHVTDFIIATIGQPIEDRLTALAGLKAAFFQTKTVMEPLSKLKAMEVNPKHLSTTTAAAQLYVIGSKLSNYVQVNNTELAEHEVPVYDPDVTSVNKTCVRVMTYANVQSPLNPMDVSLNPQTPIEIQAMMKTQSSIAERLPDVPFKNTTFTCQDINKIMKAVVIIAASDLARDRWLKRGPPNITFHDDVISTSKLDWISSEIDLVYGERGSLQVTSPSYKTLSGGNLYCKLVSPYRILEWMYIDSLKQNL